jgi:glyoxylase-like metal-dependent hydrolase (beta-lactamase superfamily II)
MLTGAELAVLKGHAMATRLLAVLLLTVVAAHAQQPQAPPRRAISRIAGDLYRVQNNDHYTVFLVTPDGIVLADPINADLATWLKGELGRRFPNTPVRYVVHSHHHQDHASGGAVLNDTAEIIAHQNFAAAVQSAAGQDKRYAAVVPPESTYSTRRSITLGGKTVELIHPGRMGHAPDFTVLYFPAERAVFGVDFMAINTVPGSNTLANGAPAAEYIAALRTVEAIDFDIAVPGHGPIGKKDDVVAHRQYFEKLAERVAAGIAAGKTLEELQAAGIMAEYKGWIEYDEDNDINIANIYKTLSAGKR